MTAVSLPKAFIWRRLHSLMGLWIVVFLIEHLLTNSQAALWVGENGQGFVKMVNALHNLPFLQVIEWTLIGVPLAIHMVWGVLYLFTGKFNSFKRGAHQPHLSYARNHAYTWQRITSWILLIGLIGHVYKFRFLEYPQAVQERGNTYYLVTVTMDQGLYTLSDRLGVLLYDQETITKQTQALKAHASEQTVIEAARVLKNQQYDPWTGPVTESYDAQKAVILNSAEQYESHVHWMKVLAQHTLKPGEVLASSKDFGTATLLTVRDTFKHPLYIGLYTIFVLAACFHAFNGFWTFLITWGWVLKMAAQRTWVGVSVVLMILMAFLGLAAIWGTYWINLRY